MRTLIGIAVFAFLLSCSQAGSSKSAVRSQQAQLTVTGNSYSSGNCVHIDAAQGSDRLPLDSCRGWGIEGCSELMTFRQEGVVRDTVYIATLNASPRPRIDAAALVEGKIKATFGAQFELLRFKPERPKCIGTAMLIRYAASYVRERVGGSATPVSGQIEVSRDGATQITVEQVKR